MYKDENIKIKINKNKKPLKKTTKHIGAQADEKTKHVLKLI